jgi:lipopolysaccharide transport system ATP-binding protein
MTNDLLVDCENVGKKFCRELKKSLWYGITDIASDIFRTGASDNAHAELRAGEFWANREVSFQLHRGECLGLIGRNGAGKTTLLKMLNGLIKPDTGRIEIYGKLNALIALGAGFNPVLTGFENIYVNGSILGLSRKQIRDRIDEIVDFAELSDAIHSPIRNYSSGMQVRLGFAIAAILVRPDILLLDEVLAVGDASFHVKCVNVILEMQRSGIAICLVSHNLQNILRYCDRGLYLQNGQVKATGDIKEVANLYQLDSDATRQRSTDSGNVDFDSQVKITSLKFVTAAGISVERITPTESVAIEATYEVQKTIQDSELVVEFLLTDIYGIYHQSFSPPLAFDSQKQCGLIRVEIQSLHAATSKLFCDFTIWNGKMNSIIAWSRGNKISLIGEPTAGRVVLNTRWSIQDALPSGVP